MRLVGILKEGMLTLQVNSFGSLAQAVVVFLLLPGLAALRGINPTELPQYLTEGAGATPVPADHAGIGCSCPLGRVSAPY